MIYKDPLIHKRPVGLYEQLQEAAAKHGPPVRDGSDYGERMYTCCGQTDMRRVEDLRHSLASATPEERAALLELWASLER